MVDPAQACIAAEALVAEFGRVDILVNCAGITGKTNIKSHEVDLVDLDPVINFTLRSSLIAFQVPIGPMLAALPKEQVEMISAPIPKASSSRRSTPMASTGSSAPMDWRQKRCQTSVCQSFRG